MPILIAHPTRIEAAGNKPKLIDEYIGRVNSGESKLSVAHMRSPGGWVEPGQTPDFDEFIACLTAHGVEFVVGAYALAFHGAPRFTGDLDGTKTWEIRGRRTHKDGRIALIRGGSGLV